MRKLLYFSGFAWSTLQYPGRSAELAVGSGWRAVDFVEHVVLLVLEIGLSVDECAM